MTADRASPDPLRALVDRARRDAVGPGRGAARALEAYRLLRELEDGLIDAPALADKLRRLLRAVELLCGPLLSADRAPDGRKVSDAELLAASRPGRSQVEIARALGVDRTTIYRRLRKLRRCKPLDDATSVAASSPANALNARRPRR